MNFSTRSTRAAGLVFAFFLFQKGGLAQGWERLFLVPSFWPSLCQTTSLEDGQIILTTDSEPINGQTAYRFFTLDGATGGTISESAAFKGGYDRIKINRRGHVFQFLGATIKRLDDAGNEIWSNVDTVSSYLNFLGFDKDDLLVVKKGADRLMRFADDGSIMLEKTLPFSVPFLRGHDFTPEGGLFFTFHSAASGEKKFVRLDDAFEIVWEREIQLAYAWEGVRLAADETGFYLIDGLGSAVFRFDGGTGDLIWTKNLSQALPGWMFFESFGGQTTLSGDFVAPFPAIKNSGTFAVQLICLDKMDGHLKWSRAVTDILNGSLEVTGFSRMPDGGFVVNIPRISDSTLIVRTDSLGKVQTTSTADFSHFSKTKIWPNPAAEKAEIRLDSPENEPFDWKMFDLAGREVQRGAASGPAFWIEKKGLSSGVFAVLIRSKKGETTVCRIVFE